MSSEIEAPTIKIYLTFKGFSNDVAAVGDLLGIEPTTAVAAGGLTKAGRTSKSSYWSAILFSEELWDIGDALDTVLSSGKLSSLLSKRNQIDGRGWLSVTVSCGKKPSLYITHDVLRRLDKLKIDVDIDFFDRKPV